MACSTLTLSRTLKHSKNQKKTQNKLTGAQNEVLYYCIYPDRTNQVTKEGVGWGGEVTVCSVSRKNRKQNETKEKTAANVHIARSLRSPSSHGFLMVAAQRTEKSPTGSDPHRGSQDRVP